MLDDVMNFLLIFQLFHLQLIFSKNKWLSKEVSKEVSKRILITLLSSSSKLEEGSDKGLLEGVEVNSVKSEEEDVEEVEVFLVSLNSIVCSIDSFILLISLSLLLANGRSELLLLLVGSKVDWKKSKQKNKRNFKKF